MRIKEVKLFSFAELSDEAKEKAREWYRERNMDDSFWSECVMDDAKELLEALGFSDVKISFSGFWSQGDGACFTGNWYVSDVNEKKFKDNYPNELKEEAQEIFDIAKKLPEAYATLKKRDHHYQHEDTVEVECFDFTSEQNIDGSDVPVWDSTREEIFKEMCMDLMRWIYRSLEKEWDFVNSDECVDENIEANEYEFTEAGRIA